MASFEHKLSWDNLSTQNLPISDDVGNSVRDHVSGACYSPVLPSRLREPELVSTSSDALREIGLSEEDADDPSFLQFVSGNYVPRGCNPVAHCYCGYQFGLFSGQLGDGAAISLGEVLTAEGKRWELNLKGAGLTPYSRQADGRKVLRSSLREYLASEVMHALDVPTTRALSLVTSFADRVERDPQYNGNPKMEPMGLVMRMAPTFIRFGSFEICRDTDPQTRRQGPSTGRAQEILPKLVSHVVNTFYNETYEKWKRTDVNSSTEEITANNETSAKTEFLLREIVKGTAELVSHWQSIGFVHGVLNTDNMSILSLTIDYGPFGFLDGPFDSSFTPNGSDNARRYCYKDQPKICKWNCMKLYEALQPLLLSAQAAQLKDELSSIFDAVFSASYLRKMRRKLGLVNSSLKDAEDKTLIRDFLELLENTGADFHAAFRALENLKSTNYNQSDLELFVTDLALPCPSTLASQIERKRQYTDTQLSRMADMVNRPEGKMMLEMFGIETQTIIDEMALEAKKREWEKMTSQEKKVRDCQLWVAWINRYLERIASSDMDSDAISIEQRLDMMKKANPRFVLRNWILEECIRKVEDHQEFEAVEELRRLCSDCYGVTSVEAENLQDKPAWASSLVVTCSS